MIAIVDYGMGNLGSIANMIKKNGYKCNITSDIFQIKVSKKIILPGVGSFDKAVENLRNLGIIDIIKQKVLEEKTPLLGICLGMQLLTHYSEEGKENGLGLVDANVIKFKFPGNELKVPHMGWNTIEIKKKNPLLYNLSNDSRFYFVHSYLVNCWNIEDVLTITNYGIPFASSFAKDNILGVQFHPEKSHKYGFQLLKNFIDNF